jgi:hypothetical protein
MAISALFSSQNVNMRDFSSQNPLYKSSSYFWSLIGKVLPIGKTLIRHDIFRDIVEFVLIRSMRFIVNNLASLGNFLFFLLSI